MKMYIAGVRPYMKHIVPEKHPVLLSWAYNVNELHDYFHEIGHDIMIDSGAFTVWKSGGTLDKKGYFDWCSEHLHCDYFIAPDVIGGSVQENLDNLHEMLNHVPKEKIMPVFHEGDDLELLEKYIEMKFSRIGLGATKSRGRKELTQWLDEIFRKYPYDYHGLAMTQPKLMKYYARLFQSVDSTTWLCFAKYGVDSNIYLLKDRSLQFYRKLGILVLDDLLFEKESEQLKEVQVEKARAIQGQMNWLEMV